MMNSDLMWNIVVGLVVAYAILRFILRQVAEHRNFKQNMKLMDDFARRHEVGKYGNKDKRRD